MSQGHIRAKFRCMGVERTWDSAEIVRFSAVHSNKSGVEIPENRAFWKATPSGEITLRLTNPEAFGRVKSGDFYYIDFREPGTDPLPQHDEPLMYELHMYVEFVGRYARGSAEIRICPTAGVWDDKQRRTVNQEMNGKLWKDWTNGEVKMTVDNKDASSRFEPDQKWHVDIRLAPE
jgi:hypothetical protein